MDTRFNSFYKEQMHPFVDAMVGVLSESGARAQRPAFATYLMRSTQQKYDADIELLKKVAGEAIAERQAHPSDKKDLLNAMLKGRDPKTGERMTEQSIMNNMITFLIAGKPLSLSSKSYRPSTNISRQVTRRRLASYRFSSTIS
jgi:cytochrome P450 / NADPH-cytochrome P450 reductase